MWLALAIPSCCLIISDRLEMNCSWSAACWIDRGVRNVLELWSLLSTYCGKLGGLSLGAGLG